MIGLALAAAISAIPVSDVDAGCARAAHGNPVATASCVSDEQENYDGAKHIWPIVPEEIRRNCIAVMGTDAMPRAYGRLANCLVYMLPTIRAANQTRFKR